MINHTWRTSINKEYSPNTVPSPVFLSRPDKSGRARISGRLGKIARIMPGFLWFCPDFCDSVHVQSVMELFAKQQKNAEYKVTRINTEMLVLYGKYLDFCPDSTRIFAKRSPGFRPDFYKIELGWRISNTGFESFYYSKKWLVYIKGIDEQNVNSNVRSWTWEWKRVPLHVLMSSSKSWRAKYKSEWILNVRRYKTIAYLIWLQTLLEICPVLLL